MSEEDISQKCGLKNVDETRNYFINPWNALWFEICNKMLVISLYWLLLRSKLIHIDAKSLALFAQNLV